MPLDLSPNAARAIVAVVSYTAQGVFASVQVKRWARVMPKLHSGTLDEALAAERARNVRYFGWKPGNLPVIVQLGQFAIVS